MTKEDCFPTASSRRPRLANLNFTIGRDEAEQLIKICNGRLAYSLTTKKGGQAVIKATNGEKEALYIFYFNDPYMPGGGGDLTVQYTVKEAIERAKSAEQCFTD